MARNGFTHAGLRRLKGLILGLLVFCAPLASFGQTLPSRPFSLAEGLPETSVIALTQDGWGRLWVVTEMGAAWYDGHEFRSLTTAGSGLPNTRVSALAADPGPAAGLWLGLRDGSLCYVDATTGRARRVLPRVAGRLGEVRALLALGTGATQRVWVGTAGGELSSLRWPGSWGANADSVAKPAVQQVLAPAAPSELPGGINALAAGPAGTLWAATEQGLRCFDEATGHRRALPAGLPAALASGPVLGLSASADGRLWCATPTVGLFVFDPPAAGGAVRQYTTAQGLCSDRVLRAVAAPGPGGRVWVLTGEGLCYLDQATAPAARCLPGTGLVSHTHRRGDLLLDHEGNLWTTSANGVTQYPPDGRFALFNAADGLPGTKVYALAPARTRPGQYWVGTSDGLALLQPATATAAGRCRVLPRRQPAVHNIIRALLVRANGDVWAGTPQGGTAVWEVAAGRWRPLAASVPPLRETTVTSLAEDARGRVWLGTDTNGLVVYDPATGVYAQYIGPALAGARRVGKVLRSRAGTMWLGLEGVGLVEAQEGVGGGAGLRFRPVAARPAGTEPFPVYSLSEDAHGRLWLASFGEGLFTYDPARPASGLRRVALREVPGAHLNNPYFVQCDAAGAVWLGTTRGLLRYNPATTQQNFFGREDGFIGQETGLNAVLAEPGGTLWAGTVAGLMRYVPAGARPNRVPPRPRLLGLRLFLRDTVLRAGSQLPHRLNHFTFDYGAISLTTPGRVRYQYRLVGFETHWNGPLAARSATYTNLPPGDYRFEVRAANEVGVWSPRPATFAFVIRPPWWRTWWAYLGYAAVLLLALLGVRRYTERRERAQAEQRLERLAFQHLQAMDELKTNFFTNISHELRTPLTLILGPAAELAGEEGPAPAGPGRGPAPGLAPPEVRQRGQLVLRHARKLLRLINQLLDLSKLEAGALRLHPVAGEAVGFAQQVAAAFQDLARQRDVTLAVETSAPELPLAFDPDKLEEILSNLLANALRFTPAGGRVTLRVAEQPATAAAPAGLVEFAVVDTGPGIAPEQLPHLFGRFYQAAHPRPTEGTVALPHTGTGLGLALVKELAELHGGTASVTSVVGEGCTFLVRLPRLETLPVLGAAAGVATAAPGAGAGPSPALALLLAEAAAAPLLAGAAAPVALSKAPPIQDGIEEGDSKYPAPCVLIVEDNADVRSFIRDTLAPAGYQLLEAADAAAGLAVARAEGPDLVVSDVMMPGELDGFDLCAQLKTDPATSHMAVVMLTARASLPDKLAGLETGADAYLGKPFHPRELRAQVANLLALRQHQRQRLAATLAPVPRAEVGSTAVPASPAVAEAVLQSPLAVHLAAVAALPSLDQQFLARAHEAVVAHLDDDTFSVEDLSAALNLSRAQAHRKLKALTGQSPGEFVRTTRLLRAHALLQGRVGTVAEVAYRVGFVSPAHFSTAFSRQFGCAPSEVGKGMAA